ncbi:response regulator [Rubrivivax sp. RP6-9]|uniref:response regulator n=1 Tax=Rubrivivax sp. RP6-9 TaxID=3415750 RepID=UPI003CC5D805
MPRSSNFQAGGRVIVANKGRILVVDDDRLVLATVTHGLKQAGYEVFDADNGDDAILLAREQRPELALLDIRMEGKSGFDVAEVLRDKYHIPFLFLSAFSDAATVAQVQALGAVAYMVKPLDVGQIVPTVEAAFQRLRAGAVPVVPPSVAANDAPAVAPAPGPDVLADAVPLAVGVLMHKHALTRVAAHAMLRQRAQEEGLSALAKAQRLLAALEELARS